MSGLRLTQVWGKLMPNNSTHNIKVEVLTSTNERQNGLIGKRNLNRSLPRLDITSGNFVIFFPTWSAFLELPKPQASFLRLVAIILHLPP